MVNEAINVDLAIELGKQQLEEFIANWPESFHEKVKSTIVPWTINRKELRSMDIKL